MRTIKFRGKRIDNGEWVYGDLIHLFSPNTAYSTISPRINQYLETDGEGHFESHEVHPKTVGQFTGLLDKNGKEIYEGDLVRIREGSSIMTEVKWNEYTASFLFVDTIAKHRNWTAMDFGMTKVGESKAIISCEVISNIHDKKAKSCDKSCSPSDMHKGGKCDLNGCYED